MAKKYTTDILSATQGVYGKQLYANTGETVANIVSYTETGGTVINNVADVYLSDFGSFYLEMYDYMNYQMPTFSAGDNILLYNGNGSEVSVLVDFVDQSYPDYASLYVSIVSGTPSGYYLPQYGTNSLATNIITDTDITGILNPNDYVFLGVDVYLLDTASGTNISISKAVPDIANIQSIQSSLDFPILNYKSVLTNGTILTSPLPVYFNTVTNTASLLGIKLATNSGLNSFFFGNTDTGSGTSGDIYGTTFVGARTGKDSINPTYSVFIGSNAGEQAERGYNSVFIGNNAGFDSVNSNYSVLIGQSAGNYGQDNQNGVFIGSNAGSFSSNSSNSVFIGSSSGYQSSGNMVAAVGRNSASRNSGDYVTALGSGAATRNSGDYVAAFGENAANGNTLSNQTIFSNSVLPTYDSRSTATTVITVANGASSGNTYLYYNSSNFQIEGVRL